MPMNKKLKKGILHYHHCCIWVAVFIPILQIPCGIYITRALDTLRLANACESSSQNEQCHSQIRTDDGDYFNEVGKTGDLQC